MEWLFEGLTLLAGIILGVIGDRAFIHVQRTKSLRQVQKAGNQSTLTQVGRDMTFGRPSQQPNKELNGDADERESR